MGQLEQLGFGQLASGSQGELVAELQMLLNQKPSSLAALREDGIFGAKTSARVREFQTQNQLLADGIVGPKTWGKLLSGKGPSQPKRASILCGTGDSRNEARGQLVAKQLSGLVPAQSATTATLVSFAPTERSSALASLLPVSSPIRMMDATQRALATSVFGPSLDFSRIFISTATGIGGLPFTIATTIPPLMPGGLVVQIMNLGTFSPSSALLIHELSHVWQAQHHLNPFQFMVNSVASQAEATIANQAARLFDSTVASNPDFPLHFPFSAYAFKSGSAIATLGAEQFAQSNELSQPTVRAYVKSFSVATPAVEMMLGLAVPHIADRRATGVII